MGNNQIAIRFTEDKYATRYDVARTLGTNLIDPMWNDILKYRNSLKHQLAVYDVGRSAYFVTNTTKNTEKVNSINESLKRFASEYSQILGGNISKNNFKKEMQRITLHQIAKLNNLQLSDLSIDKIIDNKPYDMDHAPIARYLEAVKKLTYSDIDDDFLATNLSIIRGVSELTSFYRINDIDSISSKYLISREYEQAPSKDIEFLMNNLFNLVNDPNESITNKIAATIYMFNYVKPFDQNNDEICLLIIRNILGRDLMLLPIESLVTSNMVKNYSKEIQKTRDLTYLLIPVMDMFEKLINTALDKISQINGKDVHQAFVAGDSKEEFKKEFGFEPKPEVLAPKVNVDEKPVQPKPEVKEIVKPVKPVQPIHRIETPVIEENVVDEKALKARMNNLLESDPYLKKSQAHFYVRHCTKGKFYTIQQFKKEEGCVYETARTSMDNLAKLGYYRREQIKNKFVYTPIER